MSETQAVSVSEGPSGQWRVDDLLPRTAVTQSTTLGKLGSALAKAQAAMGHASKDSTNPHLKNRYADLTSVLDASRALAQSGVAIHQAVLSGPGEAGVATTLIHAESGEWIRSECWARVESQKGLSYIQAHGSITTYLRRYSLSAACGIGAEDDDGAAGPTAPRPRHEAPKATPELLQRVGAAVLRLQAINDMAGQDAARDVLQAGQDAEALTQILMAVEDAVRNLSPKPAPPAPKPTEKTRKP